MASIRKRGNTYQITVSNGRDATGKQIIETATFTPDPKRTEKQNQKALEQFAVEFERDVKDGQNVKGRKMTLKTLSELFLDDNKPGDSSESTMSITTWSEYRRSLEKRILPQIGHIKIADITPKIMKDYGKAMRADGSRQDGKPGGLSESTITKDFATVSSILSYAVGEGLLPLNPLIYAGKQAKGHKVKHEYKVQYLTIEQTQAFLWALDHPIMVQYPARQRKKSNGELYTVAAYSQEWKLSLKWRAYFYLSLFVGDRRGENISLKWNDVNLSTGEVHIKESTAYVDKQIHHKETKTYQSRTAVIPAIVISILKQWKVEQMKMSVEYGSYWVGYRGNDFEKNYIFTQDTGKQMHPDSPYTQFKRIIRIYNDNAAPDEAHRIPDNIRPHDLRHTAASILIANNMDPRSVAGVLGHANASTTLDIYSYFFQSKNQEAANIMQQVLSSSS